MSGVEQIAISKFKASCLSILEEVRKTGKPVVVTRFGKPVATIEPPPAPKEGARRLGSMAGTGRILADIVEPAVTPEEWDAIRA
ncbi:MAG: type II toxin-antitoxin system prevent-host-death family antitoxin [Acidobacteria bacterium]|nr:type II toxin-antitoxin system prevent-host-death family antitoxin [Acidobacteriota bacterium]